MSKRKSSGEDPSREFVNEFQEYHNEALLDSSGQLESKLSAQLRASIDKLLIEFETGYSVAVDWKDGSVYTGTAGVALLYLHLYQRLYQRKSDGFLLKAKYYIDGALERQKSRAGAVAFLGGEAGPLAVAAVVYHLIGQCDKSRDFIARLTGLSERVFSDPTLPNELLFGRAGYLFALLFVRLHITDGGINDTTIAEVLHCLIDAGVLLAAHKQKDAGLMFQWHDKMYLGAAHGVSGILHTLMQCLSNLTVSDLSLVRKSVDFVQTLRYVSGNYPSSIGSETNDRLVHWCHGAPGFVCTLLEAHRVFNDSAYLAAAKVCGEVIWRRGLLRKGCGLCHGAAGNAYGLLALYQATQDQRYLYQAYKFAEWCCDYHQHGCRTPDRPYSLFEGLAGTIYFLVDMLRPTEAKFPAFQL